jgi:uncharacterized protein
MLPFHPLFTNPHVQTIAGNYWPRPFDARRFPVEATLYRTEPDVQVLVETQRPPAAPRGHVVMVHGLEGSGESGYMRSLSYRVLEAGFAAHRFHMRTCGGTAHLCRTLYHAGLTADLRAVLREFERQESRPVFLVGFSLGGNVVLKLAGELGDDAPQWIRAVCAVSTPIDLAACARHLRRPANRLYERRFAARMRQRLQSTGRYKRSDFAGLQSVYAIDDRITAPSFGFRGAEHYYATQSANQYLGRIRIPTLLIQARDDTFIPFEVFEHPAIHANPRIHLAATDHGGHLGFIARGRPRLWLDAVIVEWLAGRIP